MDQAIKQKMSELVSQDKYNKLKEAQKIGDEVYQELLQEGFDTNDISDFLKSIRSW